VEERDDAYLETFDVARDLALNRWAPAADVVVG
jgi:hypothetical protein